MSQQHTATFRPMLEATQPASKISAVDEQASVYWLLAIVAVAMMLRLGLYMFGPGQDIERAYSLDTPRYLELADNLATYGSFGLASEHPGTIYEPLLALRGERGELESPDVYGLRPELMRTPGYPAFLAMLSKAGASLNVTLLVQCVLSGGCIVLVFLLGWRLLGMAGPALFAAVLVAMHPAEVIAANSLLSETLFTFVMLAGLTIALYYGRRHLQGAVAGGVILGLSALVRPIGMWLGLAVAIWMFATNRQWRTFVLAAMLGIASLVPSVLWAMRNDKVGYAFDISYVDSLQHFSKTAAFMELRATGEPWTYPQDWRATYDRLLAELEQTIGPDETVIQAMNRMALERVVARPDLYAGVIADSALKFMTDHSLGGLYQMLGREYEPSGIRDELMRGDFSALSGGQFSRMALPLAWSGMNVLMALAMLAGFIALLCRRRWDVLLLTAGIMFYFVFATQAHGLERMRTPVLGIQAIAIASLFIRRHLPSVSQAPTAQVR